jgi:hypothetical protein
VSASEWDSEQLREFWKQAEENWYRYYVTVGRAAEKEVTVTEWRSYERQAGFIPGFRGCNATGGFQGWVKPLDKVRRQWVKGRMVWVGPQDNGEGQE